MFSTITPPLSIAPRARRSLATALARIAGAIHRDRKERELVQAVDRFSQLSPHLLRDMGIICDPRAPLDEMIRQAHAYHGR